VTRGGGPLEQPRNRFAADLQAGALTDLTSHTDMLLVNHLQLTIQSFIHFTDVPALFTRCACTLVLRANMP